MREATIRVWDPFVRAFHWTLVATFALCWFTPHAAETLHGYLGYAALALIVARVVWGFAGPPYARFSSFVRSPAAVAAYISAIARGREPRYIGHNPAGGAMIVALMLGIVAAGVSGWALTTDAFWGSEAATGVHSLIAHAVAALIVFHLGGVALASFRHRENLPRAMLTGAKRAPAAGDVG